MTYDLINNAFFTVLLSMAIATAGHGLWVTVLAPLV